MPEGPFLGLVMFSSVICLCGLGIRGDFKKRKMVEGECS